MQISVHFHKQLVAARDKRGALAARFRQAPRTCRSACQRDFTEEMKLQLLLPPHGTARLAQNHFPFLRLLSRSLCFSPQATTSFPHLTFRLLFPPELRLLEQGACGEKWPEQALTNSTRCKAIPEVLEAIPEVLEAIPEVLELSAACSAGDNGTCTLSKRGAATEPSR